MRPKTLAILAALVAILAGFIFFYERELPSTEERKAKSGRALPFESEDLTALEIEWGGKTVRFEREAAPEAKAAEDEAPAAIPPAPEPWKLVAPIQARADRGAVDRLAGDLARLDVVRTLDDASRADSGLEPPRGRVFWKTKDAEGTLEVGGEVPASSNVLAAASTRAGILVVPKYFVAELEKPAGDWRAREVLDATREAIERVRLLPAGGGEIVLARAGDGFRVEKPYQDEADREVVDPLLGDLVGLRAGKFLDPPLAPDVEAALAGAGRIEVAVKEQKDPVVLAIGGEATPGSERYLRAGDLTFQGATNLGESLKRPAAEWRSRSWTSFESYRVERIRIEDPAGKVELARAGADWARDGDKVPYPEVGDLLYAITSARGEKVVAPPATEAYPAAAPTLTVTLADDAGKEEVLTLHAAAPEGIPARRSGRAAVVLLPGRVADEVTGKIAAVRAAKPLPGTPPGEGEKTPAGGEDD